MPSDHRAGVVTRQWLLANGWTDENIRRAVRRRHLDAELPGTYVVPTERPQTASVRAAAACARYGPDAVVVLDTAAALHGLPTPWPGETRVHIALPPGREQHQRPGLRIHAWTLPAADICTSGGLAVTSVERTLVDLMCTADRLSALSAVDAALHRGLVAPDDVARLAATTRRRRGAARSRRWWADADGRAESPLETRVRVRAGDGGYPPDDLQLRIDLPHGRRAFADLAWRQPNGRWLIGEADGLAVHEAPPALLHDRERANAITGTGRADIVRFTWTDTVPTDTIPRVLAASLGSPQQRTHPRPS